MTRLVDRWREWFARVIEVDASPDDLAALLAVVRRVWSDYAETDPYYSVLTDPKFHGVPSAEVLRLFYASGEPDALSAARAMERFGGKPGDIGTVLEFGCGVGRVSYWLARNFRHVIGVDISQGHLDMASAYMAQHGATNFTSWCAADLDRLADLPRFDMLYSVIVLQHNPPPVIKLILDTLLAKLNDGGFAIFQVPTSGRHYSFSVKRHLKHRRRITSMEMHALPLAAIEGLARRHRCAILEAVPSAEVAPPLHSHFFVLRKQ